MPAAARKTDPTGHGNPLAPGPGSSDVLIGYMNAWRAIPANMAAGIEQASNAMKALMSNSQLRPADAAIILAQVSSGLTSAAGAAAANGNPAAAAGTSSALGTLTTTNVTLSSTYAAAASSGAEPAAATAYATGLQTAAAAAASAAMTAIAGTNDVHICPIPSGPAVHGPGVVTRGSSTVLINSLPAARQGDKVYEAAGGSDPIAMGCGTVVIG